MTILSAVAIYFVYVLADAYEWEGVLSRFPELLVVQIGLIIIVAEHFDYRLFERFNLASSNENDSSEI